MEVLQVDGQILVELLHLPQFLIYHGPHQVELLDVLGLVRVLEALGELLVDYAESEVPTLVLDVVYYHIVAEFSDVEGAQADVGEVGALAVVAVHGVDRGDQLARWEPTVHLFLHVGLDPYFLASVLGALIVLRNLPLGHEVVVPRLCDVGQRLVVVAQIHLKDATVEVHVFELEDVLSIIPRPLHLLECLLLARR